MAGDPTADPDLQALRERRLQELQAQLQGSPGKDAAGPSGPAAPTAPIVTTDATLDDVLQAHDTVLVDLWAPWCGPCKMVGPILDDLAQELSGRVTIAKVNVDENPRTAQRFNVSGIPTMLLFKNGRMVDRLVGAVPKGPLKERLLAHAR